MSWTRNQKLTSQQIATIKHLYSTGVSLPVISRVVADKYGLSLSAVYYHCSENRNAYDYEFRKQKKNKQLRTREKIYVMISEGLTTRDIATLWKMELSDVNKLYLK